MTTETYQRVTAETVTWCHRRNAYADATCDRDCCDHYDVVLDQHGKPLFRVWGIGTAFETPEGYRYRLRGYHHDWVDLDAGGKRGVEDWHDIPQRPRWDVTTPDGGSTGSGNWLPPLSDTPVAPVLPEGQRIPMRALYLRPNGEAWRLNGYHLDMREVGPNGENVWLPDWAVMLPSGALTSPPFRTDLPDDARLVWVP